MYFKYVFQLLVFQLLHNSGFGGGSVPLGSNLCPVVKSSFFTLPKKHFSMGAIIMRPSSLGGGRILRRTLSVCPSVPLLDEVFFILQ